MTIVLGPRSAVDLITPDGVDDGKIFEFTVLRDSKTALQLLQETAAAIGAVNEMVWNRYSRIAFITDDYYSFYRQGETSRTMTPIASDYTMEDGVRSDTIGHMLDLQPFTDSLEWSRSYLRKAQQGQINADIKLITERWENRVDYEFINRMLTNTERAIGDSGYKVPWAIGSGMNVNYIPPQYMGRVFTSAHSHFNYFDDDSKDWEDVLTDNQEDLTEHGISARQITYFSEDDVSSVISDLGDNLVKIVPGDFQVVAGSSNAPVYYKPGEYNGQPGEVFGFWLGPKGAMALAYHPRIPQNYCITMVMGSPNASSNPLAVRVWPMEEEAGGFGLRPEPQVTNLYKPRIDKIVMNGEFGVNVSNRLGAVAGYKASGASEWVNPTIS